MGFNKEKTLSHPDKRIHFANHICAILFEKIRSRGWDSAVYHVKPFYCFAIQDDLIRNLYQFTKEHIPLFYLYELLTRTPDDLDMTQEEWEEALSETKKTCENYY